MKKIFLLFIVLVCSVNLFAQNIDTNYKFNPAKMSSKQPVESIVNKHSIILGADTAKAEKLNVQLVYDMKDSICLKGTLTLNPAVNVLNLSEIENVLNNNLAAKFFMVANDTLEAFNNGNSNIKNVCQLFGRTASSFTELGFTSWIKIKIRFELNNTEHLLISTSSDFTHNLTRTYFRDVCSGESKYSQEWESEIINLKSLTDFNLFVKILNTSVADLDNPIYFELTGK